MTRSEPTCPVSTLSVHVESAILLLRGHRVLMDWDLSRLYGVPTKVLIQAVRRNRGRFPSDFMFALTKREMTVLRNRFDSSAGWGGRRKKSHAFTEQGVAMLSSVLRSEQAVLVNVEIMRTFVRLRRLLLSHDELATKIADLENRYDGQFRAVFDALRELMEGEESPVERIGFQRPASESTPDGPRAESKGGGRSGRPP